MDKITVFSTALLPNLDYMSALVQADTVLIESHETYPKQTYRNRYKILGPNGVQNLSVPVSKGLPGSCPIADVHVSYDENWPVLHWRSWFTAYNSAPFFLYFKDDFEAAFQKRYHTLMEMNLVFLHLLMDAFGIKKEIRFTEKFEKEYNGCRDLRYEIHPKKKNLFQIYPTYYQVFQEKFPFQSNLSAIDLLFNQGPEGIKVLKVIG